MTDNQPRRRFRSATVTLGGAALIAVGITGCSESTDGSDYAQICRDDSTQTRATDENCDRPYGGSGPRYSWFYLPFAAGGLPGFGSPVNSLTGGSTVRPDSGSISRGGFGGRGGGSSVGG